MRKGEINRRSVILALLLTLAIRLAAWGTDEAAHAAKLNQTIPTMTPTGATSTPTATKPASLPPTSTQTEVPTGTLSPTSTSLPLPAVTDEPGAGSAPTTATGLPTVSLSPSPIPVTATASAEATVTPSPTLSQATAVTTATAASTSSQAEDTSAAQSSAPPPEQPGGSVEPKDGSTSPGSFCIWVGLGFLLIVAGIVLLFRSRRPGKG